MKRDDHRWYDQMCLGIRKYARDGGMEGGLTGKGIRLYCVGLCLPR
jgi:hypothetical protein